MTRQSSRDRWRPLSIGSFAREALAFPVGLAIAGCLILSVLPEPEIFGWQGVAVFAALVLAPTPLFFAAGFLLAQAKRPTPAGWPRALRSALAGVLFALGWFALSWLLEMVDATVSIPQAAGESVLWAYWLLGPAVAAVGLSHLRVGRRESLSEAANGAA